MGMTQLAICVSGPTAAGKSALCRTLSEQLSASTISFGAYVRHLADEEGGLVNVPALQDLGASLLRELGYPELLRRTTEYAHAQGTIVVVDGIRDTTMLEEVRRAFRDTYHVFLDTPDAVRFQRWRDRGDDDRPGDNEAFAAIGRHQLEISVAPLRSLADVVLDGRLPLIAMAERITRGLAARGWALPDSSA
jgi:uridine kinase